MARPAAEIEPKLPDILQQLDLARPDPALAVEIDAHAERRQRPGAGFLHRRPAVSHHSAHIATEAVCEQDEDTLKSEIAAMFRGRNELSSAVFTAQGRSLSTQASPGDGAVDADARGKAVARAAAAERGILCAARDAGRLDHRRSLAGGSDRLRQSRRARHLYGAADQGLARGRRCRPRQGRRRSSCSSGMSAASRTLRSSPAACCRSRRRRCRFRPS